MKINELIDYTQQQPKSWWIVGTELVLASMFFGSLAYGIYSFGWAVWWLCNHLVFVP